MVSKNELQNAINECMNEPFTLSKCQKLADFITIYNHFYTEPRNEPKNLTESIVEYDGESQFAHAINGKNAREIWVVMEELMDAVKVLQPRMYDSVIDRLETL